MVQANYSFGRNVFIPYSAGIVASYALSIPEIMNGYEFVEFVFFREPVKQLVARLECLGGLDVLGVSVYCWSEGYSASLSKAVKEAFPECLIVWGGPQAPAKSGEFFNSHPYVDVLVNYEGEKPFADILLKRLHGEYIPKQICGERIYDLESIPSPYLTGLFNNLPFEKYDFSPVQETHRGCGYECSFCQWGSAVFTKVRKFSDARIRSEIDWFSDKKLGLINNADANFAQYERDIDIVRYMVEKKNQTGYPNKFRASYAKNNHERVYRATKLLSAANMSKGATISFQSLDDNVLTAIKRKNIKWDNFKEIMKRYREEDIATYSELIVGLPEETYNTFADGLNTLVSGGQHQGVHCYCNSMLIDSEQNSSEYKAKYGIKTIRCPSILFHCSQPSEFDIQEYDDLVIETSTLSQDDWLRCQMLSWIVQGMHCLGLTQSIAVFLNSKIGITYRRFYEHLLGCGAFEQKNAAKAAFEAILQGKPSSFVDQRFGDIIWPQEEAGFLCMITDFEATYDKIYGCLIDLLPPNLFADLIDDLISYQKAVVIDPYRASGSYRFELKHNLHEYIQAAYLGEEVVLEKGNFTYEVSVPKGYDGNLVEYAKEVVWFGRKGLPSYQHRDIKRIV
jgi:hypothetical protein